MVVDEAVTFCLDASVVILNAGENSLIAASFATADRTKYVVFSFKFLTSNIPIKYCLK